MRWFYNLRVLYKLLFSFVVVALVAAIVGLVGITGIRTMQQADTELYEKVTVPTAQLGEITKKFQMISTSTRNVLVSDTQEDMQIQADRIRQLTSDIDALQREYERNITSNEMRDTFAQFTRSRKDFIPLRNKVVALGMDNMRADAVALINGDAGRAAEAVEAALDKMVHMQIAHAKATAEGNASLARQTTLLMVAVIVFVILVAIGFGIWLAHLISRPIKTLSDRTEHLRRFGIANLATASEAMAKGVLDATINVDTPILEIDYKDEIGALADSINGIIK